jgi:hypothetical protein
MPADVGCNWKSKSPPSASRRGKGAPGESFFVFTSFSYFVGWVFGSRVTTPRLVVPVRVEVVRHTIAPSEYGNPPGQN